MEIEMEIQGESEKWEKGKQLQSLQVQIQSRRHFATTNDGSSLLSVINDKTDEGSSIRRGAGEWPLRMPHKLAKQMR